MTKTERLSKIKRIRTWGNWGMGIGIGLMYLGLAGFFGYLGSWLAQSHLSFTILLIIGFALVLFSTVLFMISGMVSTTVPQVECPQCNKVTKMLGKEDACMYCGQPLRLEDEPPSNQPVS